MTESASRVKIKVENVSKEFSLRNSSVVALDNISLEIYEHDFLVVLGPSGCGKSTLVSLMAGLNAPDRGSVIVDGSPINRPDPKKIAIMFQDSLLLPWRTVSRNIEFVLEPRHLSRAERNEKAVQYLKLVALEGFRDAYPHQLSGGMKQRVALCRALSMETEILLMDEPFGALDEQTRLTLGYELVNIWKEFKKTIVFVTHSLSEAISLGERIAVMTYRPGKIKRVFNITIPRPRRFDDPNFNKILQVLWDDLKEEASTATRQ